MQNTTTLEQSPKKRSIFLHYIHNFRGFAILAIVAHHILPLLQWNSPQEERIAQILIGNGSVYFVFIAGFLFQFLSAKYRYKDYLRKKINYVITPYLITSIPALLLIFIKNYPAPDWFNERFAEWPIVGQLVMYLLTGAHLSGFWFIPMIALFYLVSPLLLKLDQLPRCYWVLPILCLVTLIVPRPAFNHNPFQSFVHFLSIYLAGMCCCHFRETFFFRMKKLYLPLIGIFITLTALQFWIEAIPDSINSLSKLGLCALIIYFLWSVESRTPQVINAAMGQLAEFSFGIYFIHEYFIGYHSSIERMLGLPHSLSQANLWNLLLHLIIVLGGSMLTILLIQRLFGKKSRLLVGC